MSKNFKGIFTSMITPFRKDILRVNFDALLEHVGFLADHKCDGIIPLSTYGEFYSLSLEEKKQILVSIMDVREDMLVIPNVGSDNFEETIDFAHYAQGIGVDALVIIPPYFFHDIEPEGLINYYLKVLSTVDIPVFLYNIPKYTRIEISTQLLDKLSETGKIIGIKDASGDISQVQHYKSKFPNLNVMVANEKLFFEGLSLKTNGICSYLANAFPELVKAVLFDFNQPTPGGSSSQKYLTELHNVIKKYPRISAIKYALKLRGITESFVRPPLTNLSIEKRKTLKNELEKFIMNPSLIN